MHDSGYCFSWQKTLASSTWHWFYRHLECESYGARETSAKVVRVNLKMQQRSQKVRDGRNMECHRSEWSCPKWKAMWYTTGKSRVRQLKTLRCLSTFHSLPQLLPMVVQGLISTLLGFSLALVPLVPIPLFHHFEMGMFTMRHFMLEIFSFLFLFKGFAAKSLP